MSDAADKDPRQESIAHTAAAWVLRSDRGLTATEQDEFSQWLASDPQHGVQFARHRKNWQRLESLAQWRPEHSARPNPDLLAPPRGRLLRFAPALGLAAAAAVLVFVWRDSTNLASAPWQSPGAAAQVAAPASQQTLEDGTVVELNKGALLSVRFSAAERRVSLERGEAHFTVTKNPTRPFIVTARGMEVFAVGTAFNVRLDRAVVEVLVTEGRVSVSETRRPDATGEEASTRPPVVPLLQAGERAVLPLGPLPSAPRIATLTPGEIERVLSWQHRMLEFTGAPLAEVIAEFNRRNAVKLVLVDAELAAIPFSASFRSDNIEGFVRLLEVGFGTRAERRGENEIRLRKAR